MAKISIEEAKERLKTLSSSQNVSFKAPRKQQSGDSAKKQNEVELVQVIDENILIFKNTDGSFVLTPTDDELPTIIGKFDEIPEDGTMPPCFTDWLGCYSEEVNVFQENEEPMVEPEDSNILGLNLVDLGLSVKWANMNIGATKPEENGNYYAWGETETKTEYKTSTYKYYDASTDTYKDLGNPICESVYDVAHKLNRKLSLPTIEQAKELVEKCTWTKTTLNGVNVWEVKGPNGNKIYIPISGCISESSKVSYTNNAYIWTGEKASVITQAKTVKVMSDGPTIGVNYKRTGTVVRPVASSEYDEKNEGFEFVDLGLSVNWGNMNLGASKPEENGNYYAWGETETKTEYKVSTYKYYDTTTKKYINIGEDISKNTKYDAAFANSKVMCMPTKKQCQELIDKCTWTKNTLNNINVWEVKGPNGNKIYIPISGCISEGSKVSYESYFYLWTSEYDSTADYRANCLKATDKPSLFQMYRRTGANIRPVSIKTNSDTNSKKKIDPIIPYKWSQTAPFNNLVVVDPTTNKQSVTGCSNTALSMLIAYYGIYGINGKKFRRGIIPTTAYTSTKGKVKINIPALDSIAEFDYDNLNFIKASDFKTENSKNAVATLMQHVGYASFSNYSTSGTGCSFSNIVKTTRDKIHLASNPKLIYASSGVEKFEEQIYNELLQGYPVEVAGFNSSSQYGHAFICDGYDPSTDWFHFNWGWGGNYNGWFNMSILKVNGYDFSYKRQAVVNLHPDYILGDTDNDGKINISDVGNVVQAIIDNKAYDYHLDINSDQKIDIHDVALLVDAILGKIKL